MSTDFLSMDLQLMSKPPHATVKWSHRCTPQEEEFATHYDGDWKVEVVDQDGDVSYFSVTNRKTGASIKGEMDDHGTDRCAMDICMDTAVAALRAMQAKRGDDDH